MMNRQARAAALLSLLALAPAASGRPDHAAPASPASTPTQIGSPSDPGPNADLVIAQLTAKGPKPTGDELAAIGSALKAAQEREPSNARWTYALALFERTSMEQSNDPKARREHALARYELMQNAVKLDAKSAEYYFELGNATMMSIGPNDGFMTMASRAGDAKDAWLKAVGLDANHIGALAALGTYEIQARQQGGWLFGSYSKAREYAEKLLTVPGGEFQGHMVLGAAAAAEETWDEMSRQFETAEKLTGENASPTQAMYAHANALLNSKKDAKAAKAVIERLAAAAAPDDYSILYLRGTAEKLDGDCQAAVADYLKVLERNPGALNTRYFIAECYEKLGDLKAAVRHYEEFLSRFPADKRAEAAASAATRLKKQIG